MWFAGVAESTSLPDFMKTMEHAAIGVSVFTHDTTRGTTDDEANGGFFTRFFDNAGFHPEYSATVNGDVWRLTEPSTRAILTVEDGGNHIEHAWEWLQGGKWLPLCERTATRL